MRRWLALLLCLMMIPVLPAWAEESEGTALFRLTETDESGREITIGTAVLALDEQLLFTSAIMENPGRVSAYGPDGAAYEAQLVMTGDSGLAVLLLEESAEEAVPLFSEERVATSRLVGMTLNGLRYDLPAASVSRTIYQGREAYLVSALEPLLPGAVLLDSEGGLIGMTVAEWGEGEARYVALTGDAFIDAVLEMMLGEVDVESLQEPGDDFWLMDAELVYDSGVLTVDWRHCQLEGLNEQSVITVYILCPVNNYYLYYSADPSEGTATLDVAPGYTYNIWVSCSDGEPTPGLSPDHALSVAIPEQGDFTDYGFTNECYLAWAPADETPEADEKLPALEPITAEALEDGAIRLYLQAINTYAVEEELETSLTFVLQSPEGYVFHSLSGYIFMPEIQEEDVWNADITPLLERYLAYNGSGAFAPGEYTLSYLIGGQWAGSVSFTLE